MGARALSTRIGAPLPNLAKLCRVGLGAITLEMTSRTRFYYYYYYYYKLYLGTVESSVKNFTIVNIYKFTVKLFTKKQRR